MNSYLEESARERKWQDEREKGNGVRDREQLFFCLSVRFYNLTVSFEFHENLHEINTATMLPKWSTYNFNPCVLKQVNFIHKIISTVGLNAGAYIYICVLCVQYICKITIRNSLRSDNEAKTQQQPTNNPAHHQMQIVHLSSIRNWFLSLFFLYLHLCLTVPFAFVGWFVCLHLLDFFLARYIFSGIKWKFYELQGYSWVYISQTKITCIQVTHTHTPKVQNRNSRSLPRNKWLCTMGSFIFSLKNSKLTSFAR